MNTACKLLLLTHAFESLGCGVVGLRTDNFNFASQRAIERLGAKKDGVLRHHQARRDGTVRDSVMYSILAPEWRDVKRHLELRLARHVADAVSGPGSAPGLRDGDRLRLHGDRAGARRARAVRRDGETAPIRRRASACGDVIVIQATFALRGPDARVLRCPTADVRDALLENGERSAAAAHRERETVAVETAYVQPA